MQEENEEVMTIEDVVTKLEIIQEMKLLFLQGVTFNGKNVHIHHIVNRNSLLKILRKYRNHYRKMVINNDDSIIINHLHKLSFLRVGLEKEILRFMEPYF